MKNPDTAAPSAERAYHKALEVLLEHEISSFPVDPFAICEERGISLISVGSFCEKKGFDWEIMLNHVLQIEYGIAYYDPDRDASCIIYNEAHEDETLRYIIAHEMGHSVLGHFNSTQHIIKKGVLALEEYTSCEREADWFACTLLAPAPIVNASCIRSAKNISSACQIHERYAARCALFMRGPWSFMKRNGQLEQNLLQLFDIRGHNKKASF